MKKTGLILLLIIMLQFIIVQPVEAAQTSPQTVTDIPYDGDVWNTGVFDHTSEYLTIDNIPAGNKRRAFIEFNLSIIDPTAHIYSVELELYGHDNSAATQGLYVWSMEHEPLTRTPAQIYTDCADGTNYGIMPGLGVNESYRLNLGPDAVTDIRGTLAADWFAVGLQQVLATDGDIQIWAQNRTDVAPRLYVGTDYGNYTFVVNGGYFENGTIADAVDLTVSAPSGYYELMVNRTVGFGDSELPEAIYWAIGGGYTRYIYTVDTENFTLTFPDGVDYTYAFTIKDLTGKVGTNSYLEAYRIINGTQTLVTRMPIEQPNAVPMNLVFGRTYRLRILFDDGTRYDWGYFIPGSDTTITLIIREVAFTDQAQILYNHIHVDATRPLTNTITVDYLDDRAHTVWANITIRERGGPVVLFAARNNNSYTLNWASANASLGYVVTVTGYHTDYGAWGRSFILDRTYTFPAAPSLDGILGVGTGDLLGFFIICIVIIIFPSALQPVGLLAGCTVATTLTFFGWTSYSYDWLAFTWFISVMINLVAYQMGRFNS